MSKYSKINIEKVIFYNSNHYIIKFKKFNKKNTFLVINYVIINTIK